MLHGKDSTESAFSMENSFTGKKLPDASCSCLLDT